MTSEDRLVWDEAAETRHWVGIVSLIAMLVIAGLIAGAYVAWPFWTLREIERALIDRDREAIEAAVDWPQLREQLKVDLQRAGGEPLANPSRIEMAAAQFGTKLTNLAVETVVKPEWLFKLTALDKLKPGGLEAARASAAFLSPTRFRVGLRAPEKPEVVFGVVLDLQDYRWRVTRIEIPPEAYEQGQKLQHEMESAWKGITDRMEADNRRAIELLEALKPHVDQVNRALDRPEAERAKPKSSR